MSRTVHALLDRLIDYAGLFPPAGLGMAETVANYAAYQRRGDAWALARLVVPVNRLAEFEIAFGQLPPSAREGTGWPITGLVGADPVADRPVIQAFNQRQAGKGPRIESLEVRVASTQQIEAVAESLSPGLEHYCELPLTAELPALVATAKQCGVRAKVRTGGVNAADIPAPEAILAFLAACAAERLAFKATAGLHHPVRGLVPLTYAPSTPYATMFGYLNVILAASLVWAGRAESDALAVLTAENHSLLRLEEEVIEWGAVRIRAEEIERARREFVLAIGSCSFTEPLGEIRQLGAEPAAGATPANVAEHRNIL